MCQDTDENAIRSQPPPGLSDGRPKTDAQSAVAMDGFGFTKQEFPPGFIRGLSRAKLHVDLGGHCRYEFKDGSAITCPPGRGAWDYGVHSSRLDDMNELERYTGDGKAFYALVTAGNGLTEEDAFPAPHARVAQNRDESA